MNILFFSPGFPGEMPFFAAALAEVGARVWGIGDQPAAALPERARRALSGYTQTASLWDEDDLLRRVREIHRKAPFDRIECLWEPGMLLAAKLREALGVPGMTVAQTVPFRDKEAMKSVLDAAGVRTPRHFRATSSQACREAVERLGFPAILKPISGAGSADTHRVESSGDLDKVLKLLTHIPEVSVEEFIEGEEYTFDTISIGGRIAYYNIGWYRPKPLIARTVPWISPQTLGLRNVERPELAGGRRMGAQVLQALGFGTGFTHMEWFLTPSGEAVFGEIGARPPGGRSVETMNYACDIDVFRGWAEAVALRRFSQPVRRRYNSVVVFKRAQGEGRIQRIQGLEGILGRYGDHIVSVELLPVGAPRRNWKASLLSDGWIIARHPVLGRALEIGDRIGTDLQIFAR
ncbi:MAG: ATP-grasp domain-containing protein [Acidobacteriota bacterium]